MLSDWHTKQETMSLVTKVAEIGSREGVCYWTVTIDSKHLSNLEIRTVPSVPGIDLGFMGYGSKHLQSLGHTFYTSDEYMASYSTLIFYCNISLQNLLYVIRVICQYCSYYYCTRKWGKLWCVSVSHVQTAGCGWKLLVQLWTSFIALSNNVIIQPWHNFPMGNKSLLCIVLLTQWMHT